MKPFTVEFDDGKMSDYLRKEDVKKDEWAALHARLWFETTAYPASDFAWIDGQFVLASVVRGSTVLKCQLRLKPTRFMPRRGSIWGMRILAPETSALRCATLTIQEGDEHRCTGEANSRGDHSEFMLRQLKLSSFSHGTATLADGTRAGVVLDVPTAAGYEAGRRHLHTVRAEDGIRADAAVVTHAPKPQQRPQQRVRHALALHGVPDWDKYAPPPPLKWRSSSSAQTAPAHDAPNQSHPQAVERSHWKHASRGAPHPRRRLREHDGSGERPPRRRHCNHQAAEAERPHARKGGRDGSCRPVQKIGPVA